LILIMCIVMSLGLAGSLSASDLPGMVKSLSGIKGLDVFVFELPDEASKAGLVAADLEEIVEKKLSFSKIDIRDDHRPPFLVLSLRSINNEEEKKIFYHLDVWVWQAATLIKNPDVNIGPIITWRSDTLGVVSVTRYKEKIMNRLNSIMDDFLKDYQAANPQ